MCSHGMLDILFQPASRLISQNTLVPAACTDKCMQLLPFSRLLIALDAEIYLNGMSTTFFSVTEVPSIKNFIHHLIVLTLADFNSSAELKRKRNAFTSSVSIH